MTQKRQHTDAGDGNGNGDGDSAAHEATPSPDAGQPADSGGQAAVADTGVEKVDDADALRQELEAMRGQVEQHRERALRAHAELDNLHKRMARDVENAHKYALDRFVADLVPVLDSIELGIEASTSSDDVESLRHGMDLTLKKLADTLARFGVATVDPIGEKFNPERHEAVSAQALPDAEPGTVIAVMQKGYELNGRLVRPAMVVVAK